MTTDTKSGFSADERAAMKARAAELRSSGKKGAKAADGLQALLDKIAEMTPQDRALAERVHLAITAAGPDLLPKTWYGMPAYTDADGKLIVAFKERRQIRLRYATLEFQDSARLDDGDIWPVSFAIPAWTPAVQKKITSLIKAALS